MALVTNEAVIPQGKIQGESNLVNLSMASYFLNVCLICPLVLNYHSGLRNIKQFLHERRLYLPGYERFVGFAAADRNLGPLL